MAQLRYYSNVAVSGTIGNSGGISSSATSLFLTTTPSGYPTQFPFGLVLAPNGGINAGQAPEFVLVTAGSGTSGTPWTITRGQDGTTAAAWSNGAAVAHEASAGDFTNAALHISAQSVTSVDPQYSLPHNLPAAAWATASFAAISENTLASATASVTFNSIPGTYKHLLLVVQARISESTVQSDDLLVGLNSDASAVYSYLTTYATNITGATTTGSLTASQATSSAQTSWPMFRVAASSAGAGQNAGGGFALIPNYTSTTFNKMFYSLSGMGDGSSAAIDGRVRWGFYNPSSQVAITKITVTAPASSNMNTGSFVGLYGLS